MLRSVCAALAVSMVVSGCATVASATRTAGSIDRAFARIIDWEAGQEPQDFNIWYGEQSAVADSGFIIIRDKIRWSEAWSLTDAYSRPGLRRLGVSPARFVGPPIALHPDAHTGVALYTGTRSGGNTQLIVERVVMKNGVLTISAREVEPDGVDPRYAANGAQTAPYAILRVAAAPRVVNVEFETSRGSGGGDFGAPNQRSGDPFGGAQGGQGGDPFGAAPAGGDQGGDDPFAAAPANQAGGGTNAAPAPGSDSFDPFSGGGQDPFAGAAPAPANGGGDDDGADAAGGPRQLTSPDAADEEDDDEG